MDKGIATHSAGAHNDCHCEESNDEAISEGS